MPNSDIKWKTVNNIRYTKATCNTKKTILTPTTFFKNDALLG